MNAVHSMANLIISGLTLALLVRLYFWEYREYRMMRTRYKLFQLRNELFALGETGELAFDNKAYGLTRMLINGAIRYAHRLSMLHILIMHVCLVQSKAFGTVKIKQASRWEHAMLRLSDPTRTRVEAIRVRYLKIVIEQTVLSSLQIFK